MEFDPSFQSSFLAPSNRSQLRDLTNPNLDDDVTIAPLSQLHPNNNNSTTLLTTSISSPPLPAIIPPKISGNGDGSIMLTKIANHVANGVIIKGQWTPEEDSALKALVKEYGPKKWSEIAKHFKGRIGKQCRERWLGHLRPNIRKGPWSKEEDMMLIKLHKEIGNKWAEIARRMEGRSDNSVKNHWNAIKRRRRMNTQNFRAKRFNTYDSKNVVKKNSSINNNNNNNKKGKAKMLLCASCGNNLGDDHHHPPLLHNFDELPIYDFSNDSWVTEFYGGGSCKGDAPINGE
ncbi:hypothetical protein PIB30_048029 [Stylosanthes scabra]|uniref:Uncharacterized protein n=1 Tax=Stylosanthes scabra TaxID=79078 RepID=A0ABU6ZFP3_9FABA|nr:hypothetical protein [Stylosanthes scabra]